MIKVVFGWVLLVFGVVGAILGGMAYLGGASFGATLKMVGLGIGLAAVGWKLRARS